MTSDLIIKALAATVVAGLASPALALEPHSAPQDKLLVCQKAVSVLGASMGHKQVKAEDGRKLYRFELRTSGLDYVADCDATSGSISDVVPRVGAPATAAAS